MFLLVVYDVLLVFIDVLLVFYLWFHEFYDVLWDSMRCLWIFYSTLWHLGNANDFVVAWCFYGISMVRMSFVVIRYAFVIKYWDVIGCSRTGIFVGNWLFPCVGIVKAILNPEP